MNAIDLVSQYRVIEVVGDDAQTFLHDQLTCDLASLEAGQGSFGACLNAKGKVLASGCVVPLQDTWCLLVHPTVTDALVSHLTRYVLRADVAFKLDTPWRVRGQQAARSAREAPLDMADLAPVGANLWALSDTRQIGLATSASGADATAWRLADIGQGLVNVSAGISDRFIPQMLGLDVIGAVSFSKGCYPGQEIVARARNLGRVKRGLAHVTALDPLVVGQQVSDAAEQRAGEIIQVEVDGGQHHALAVISREAQALKVADRPLQVMTRFF